MCPPLSKAVNVALSVVLNSLNVPRLLRAILLSQLSFHALAVPPVICDSMNMIFFSSLLKVASWWSI